MITIDDATATEAFVALSQKADRFERAAARHVEVLAMPAHRRPWIDAADKLRACNRLAQLARQAAEVIEQQLLDREPF